MSQSPCPCVPQPVIKLKSLSDEELLKRSARDADAFDVFYRRHLPTVLRFALSRTGNREIAADIAAEVFACALGARESFDSRRGDARGWLCTIAANKLIDSVRRGRVEDRCRLQLGMNPIALEDRDLERVDDIAAAAAEIPSSEQLLASLPAQTRTAVEARVLQERQYSDIALELRCSEAVVRQRVTRGLARLRTQLKGKA